MTTMGDNLGAGGRQVGVGYPMPPEPAPSTKDAITFSFEGGLNLADAPEDLDPSQAQDVLGIELKRDGSIARAGGPQLVQTVSGRSFNRLFKQGGIDFAAELVAIDAPYVGVKASGDMEFTDMGIAADAGEGWFGISVLGKLLFSNGVDASYLRETGGSTVVDMTDQVIARCFAQIFGRVFAGGVTPLDGEYQALGIVWSSVLDPVGNWTGPGSGNELLLSDTSGTDKIIGLRSVGFDVLGVCNRFSLWGGYPTGDAFRPADFRPRVMSVGAVSDATICSTPMGIIMLTDDGVGVYDITNFQLLSGPINPALLPLDYAQLDRYQAVYDAQNGRYLLQTPSDLWVYDLPRLGTPGRWTRWASAGRQLVFFADQSGISTWDRQVTTWDNDPRTWNSAVQRQSDAPEELFVGTDDELFQFVPDIAAESRWRTPMQVPDEITRQAITQGYEIEYQSLETSTIELRLLNSQGEAGGGTLTKTLPASSGRKKRVKMWGINTGQNVSVELRITSGQVRVYRIRQIVMDAGAAINATVP